MTRINESESSEQEKEKIITNEKKKAPKRVTTKPEIGEIIKKEESEEKLQM